MSDIPIEWKKITRGLPKIRRHADDRAPTLEEIQNPDRRIKGIVYTMTSSGIRLGEQRKMRQLQTEYSRLEFNMAVSVFRSLTCILL